MVVSRRIKPKRFVPASVRGFDGPRYRTGVTERGWGAGGCRPNDGSLRV